MSIHTNYMVALIRESKPEKFMGMDTKYMQETDKEVYSFIIKYYQDFGSFPPVDLVRVRFNLTVLEGDSKFWFNQISNLRYSLIFENSIPVISGYITEGDRDKAKAELLKAFSEMDNSESSKGQCDRRQGLQEILEIIPQNRAMGGLIGVPTGWPTLDAITHGFCKKGVYVITARLKMGKTMLMCYSAEVAYQNGFKVLFISMEMSRVEYFTRVMSLMSRVPSHDIFYGQVSFFAERALQGLINQDTRAHEYKFQEGMFNTNVNEVGFLIQMERPDIVFIDGAYLLKLPSNSGNRMQGWEKAGEVMAILKTFSAKYDVPIVASYQFNREATKKGVAGPEHIHLSDAIPQIATTAIGVLDHPEIQSQKILSILANRNGPVGQVDINWDWGSANFSEISGYIETSHREDIEPIEPEGGDI